MKRTKPRKPRGPRNLKKHGFTNGIWRLEERAEAVKRSQARSRAGRPALWFWE